MANEKKRSADPAAQYLLSKAGELNVRTGWDRFEEQQEVCGFGDLGLCCRICLMGPCRVDPFGEGIQQGVCGISGDGIVARNLCRMIAAGTSAHSDHGVHLLETFELIAKASIDTFKIKEPAKLKSLATKLGIAFDDDEDICKLADKIVESIMREFSGFKHESEWLKHTIPEKRLEILRNVLKLPGGIDGMIRETMSRTNMGMDADPLSLLLGAVSCSISDYLGMDISTHLSDIILGTPKLTFSQGNLGVIDKDAINIAVHGHNPLIADSILQALPDFQEKARAAGAKHGINIVGVCCTGNEVLARNGIPLAANSGSQELVILTGAIDTMVVDVQCIMPSLSELCSCYHTQLITTMATAKIPNAKHMEFHPQNARAHAEAIFATAIECYKKRDPKMIHIPDIKRETLLGFSLETIVDLLSKINPDDPLQVIIDAIAKDEIHGVILFAGCNNFKVTQDLGFLTLAKKLLKDNVLVLATGCAAGAFAKAGFLSPWMTLDVCGSRLTKVLQTLGEAAGLERPLPPVWHMGSCVDNSRAAHLAFALANKLGVDASELPLVVSAPEIMHEKAITIGTWATSFGLTTHVGVAPPVLGGKVVTTILTRTIQDIFNARLIVEPDLEAAYQILKETIDDKRVGLGLENT